MPVKDASYPDHVDQILRKIVNGIPSHVLRPGDAFQIVDADAGVGTIAVLENNDMALGDGAVVFFPQNLVDGLPVFAGLFTVFHFLLDNAVLCDSMASHRHPFAATLPGLEPGLLASAAGIPTLYAFVMGCIPFFEMSGPAGNDPPVVHEGPDLLERLILAESFVEKRRQLLSTSARIVTPDKFGLFRGKDPETIILVEPGARLPTAGDLVVFQCGTNGGDGLFFAELVIKSRCQVLYRHAEIDSFQKGELRSGVVFPFHINSTAFPVPREPVLCPGRGDFVHSFPEVFKFGVVVRGCGRHGGPEQAITGDVLERALAQGITVRGDPEELVDDPDHCEGVVIPVRPDAVGIQDPHHLTALAEGITVSLLFLIDQPPDGRACFFVVHAIASSCFRFASLLPRTFFAHQSGT